MILRLRVDVRATSKAKVFPLFLRIHLTTFLCDKMIKYSLQISHKLMLNISRRCACKVKRDSSKSEILEACENGKWWFNLVYNL